MKKTIKKTIKNKYFLTGLITPLIVTGLLVYLAWYTLNYIENRDRQIFIDGTEVGRYLQLTEDAESTQLELKDKKEASKQQILNSLAKMESMNGTKRKILDTNGKYSLGLFHFQASTVKDMYKRFYNKNITIQEAVQIAENDELATKLAHDAIFVKGEKYHWKISLCKMGILTKGCLSQKQINNLFAKN